MNNHPSSDKPAPERGQKIFYPKPADFVPEPTFPPGHRYAGLARCLAWSSSHNRQCERTPMTGKTKCASHGGKSLSGIASPTLKTGRHSKVLPARLAANYEASMTDPELLSLRSEIALVDSRVMELIAKIDSGEAGKLWLELQKSMSEFDNLQRQASAAYDDEKKRADLLKASADTLNSIKGMIKHGASEWMIWQEIADGLENRRKLTETEQKRLVAMQTMVTTEQAMILVSALTAAVKKHVTDTKQLSKIQAEFVRLVNTGNEQPAIP